MTIGAAQLGVGGAAWRRRGGWLVMNLAALGSFGQLHLADGADGNDEEDGHGAEADGEASGKVEVRRADP